MIVPEMSPPADLAAEQEWPAWALGPHLPFPFPCISQVLLGICLFRPKEVTVNWPSIYLSTSYGKM